MIKITKWEEALNKCSYDSSVGIRIAKLAGNSDFSTFITEISTGKGVNAHYHKFGDEHYHIIKGKGEIFLKSVITGDEKCYPVCANESFTVPENVLHKLTNTGNSSLILMFSCPASHIEYDRYFL